MSRIQAITFFREQDARMDTSEDDIQEYHARMLAEKRRGRSVVTVKSEGQSAGSGSESAKARLSQPEHPSARSNPSQEASSRRTSPRKRTPNPMYSAIKIVKRDKVEDPEDITDDRRSPPSSPIRTSSLKRKATEGEATPEDLSSDVKLANEHATVHGGSSITSPSSPIQDASGFPPSSAPHSPRPLAQEGHQSTLLEHLRSGYKKFRSEESVSVHHSAKKARRNLKVKKLDNATTLREIERNPSSSPLAPATRAAPVASTSPQSSSKEKKAPAKPGTKGASAAKGKKNQVESQTYEECAKSLQDRAEELRARIPLEAQYYKGMKIYYYGKDFKYVSPSTRNKMGIIVELGADIVHTYDPSLVTHIILEEKSGAGQFLEQVKLSSLSEIPYYIPTLTWGYIARGLANYVKEKDKPEPDFELAFPEHLYEYAAFKTRVDPIGDEEKRRKAAKVEEAKSVGDFSHISDFSTDVIRTIKGKGVGVGVGNRHIARLPQRQRNKQQAGVSASSSSSRVPLDLQPQPLASKSANAQEDPLEEFYAQAIAEMDECDGRYGEVEGTDHDNDSGNENETDVESDRDAPASTKAKAKKGWACDGSRNNQQAACINQDIVDKLQELMELHKVKASQEDRWRVYAYTKSIRVIRNHPKRIKTLKDAMVLPGVGRKTAEKIMEIINTGDLRRIKYENTEDVAVLKIFRGIYGVGNRIGLQWYNQGARTLQDLKTGKFGIKLTPAQKIGLEFYDDINTRMPRSEAQELFERIKPIALSIDPDLFVEIMGSYRRGKADCGDIDILITRDDSDGRTHQGILKRLLKKLYSADILTEDLAVPSSYDEEEAIYRGLCHLPRVPGAKRRRIDFLCTPWKARGAALLYYTGDDIFNCSMRLKARSMGYSLNQRGLYDKVIRNPRKWAEKLDNGHIIAADTEQDIFRILGVPWQEPHERVRNFNIDSEPVAASGSSSGGGHGVGSAHVHASGSGSGGSGQGKRQSRNRKGATGSGSRAKAEVEDGTNLKDTYMRTADREHDSENDSDYYD
ncbi:hypothetical protein D9758_005201 [Tetrapyrgos nigripes]|uniref:DNA-directed DNA polymerase n=1 Tax=Tetrapyrgos nigripes TaxID=182062 RepID=A0A8H5GXE9_9AGAR|nr:hypothetical protein D9758_005201 [Tetrapyrgos nigripes]